MKRALLGLLVLLLLSGCQKSNEEALLDLGYSEKDVERILSFNEETIEVFLKKYSNLYVELINNDDFKETKLDKYLYYSDFFDVDRLIYLVNNNLISMSNVDKLVSLYRNEYYVERLENLYLKYLDKYDDVRQLIEIVNTNRYVDLYTDIKVTDLSKDYLMLINKYHQLPSDYEPSDLVEIDSYYGRGETRVAVYEAFKKMADDAYNEGYSLSICSAYRSYDYQDGLYHKYLSIDEGGQASVDTYSARPGHSEHQSGLCLDLVTPGYSMDDFGLSQASKWVNENCYKYGFIIRYTEEKTDITGYQAEAWQVRYVGSSEVAKDITDRGISFDEYYTCFVETE